MKTNFISINERYQKTEDKINNALLDLSVEVKKNIYEKTKNELDVTFDEINKLPLNEVIKLPTIDCDACQDNNLENCKLCVTFKIIKKEKNKIIAEVNFNRGATLTAHKHSDIKEEIVITEDDKVILFETNGMPRDKILSKGQTYIIPENRKHQITSHYGKKMLVIFHKI